MSQILGSSSKLSPFQSFTDTRKNRGDLHRENPNSDGAGDARENPKAASRGVDPGTQRGDHTSLFMAAPQILDQIVDNVGAGEVQEHSVEPTRRVDVPVPHIQHIWEILS